MKQLLQAWDAVWIALVASGILYGCYRAVEWRWPERYLGMHATFGLSAQETWGRFVAYRAVPTYVFAGSCFITVERVGGPIWLSALVMWIVSIAGTHGRVILEGVLRRHGEVNYAAAHAIMLVGLSVVLVAAVFTRQAWGALVPVPDELLSAMWSGLIVAGLGGLILVAVRERKENAPTYGPEYFIDRVEREIGIGVFDHLFAACVRTGADPILLKAVMVVEAVQRPRWLRNIERACVRLGFVRTSGVMQMASAKPLSDVESIDLAADAYAGRTCLRLDGSGDYRYWSVDTGTSWAAISKHNPDVKFINQVRDVADYLLSSFHGTCRTESADAPIPLELRRYPEVFALRGMTTSRRLTFLALTDKAKYAVLTPPEHIAPGRWWAFEQQFDPATETVFIGDRASGVGTTLRLADGQVMDREQRSAASLTKTED